MERRRIRRQRILHTLACIACVLSALKEAATVTAVTAKEQSPAPMRLAVRLRAPPPAAAAAARPRISFHTYKSCSRRLLFDWSYQLQASDLISDHTQNLFNQIVHQTQAKHREKLSPVQPLSTETIANLMDLNQYLREGN